MFIGHFELALAAKKAPPPVRVLAMSGLAGWLFVAWAYWIDRHRETATREGGAEVKVGA